MLCLSGWGSVILLLIGKFVGIMFIAFVGVLLDDIFNSVGEDAFTKKAAKGTQRRRAPFSGWSTRE